MLGWFVETTVVASALAVVALLAGRSTRLGPAARHLLWLVVLLKLVSPPLFRWSWFAPSEPFAMVEPGEPASPSERRPALPVVEATEPEPGPGAEVARASEPPRPDVMLRVEPEPVVIPPLASPDTAIVDQPVPSEAETLNSSSERPIEETPLVTPLELAILTSAVGGVWLIGAVAMLVRQGVRIARFRRRLAAERPPPCWIQAEVAALASRLKVRAPRVSVVPELGTPMLWCLGATRLLLPRELLGRLSPERWRGVLAHELAHLRRGDPWIRRLELLAGLIWWWNPLFWLVRSRLEIEAELACDAWVVWTLPDDRRTYAEALLDVCSTVNQAHAPSPALGIGGAGRFFERRLTMIMRSQGPCSLSRGVKLAAGLLTLLAMPAWSSGQDEPRREPDQPRAERPERDEPREPDRERPEARPREDGPRRPIRERLRQSPEGREQAEAELQRAQKQLDQARERLQTHMREMQEHIRAMQERMQAEMREAHEQLRRAEQEFMEAQGRLGERGPRPGARGRREGPSGPEGPRPPGAGPEAPKAPGEPPVPPGPPEAPGPRGMMMGRGMMAGEMMGPGMMGMMGPQRMQELEKRMERLESKFDQILEELRAQRRDREPRP